MTICLEENRGTSLQPEAGRRAKPLILVADDERDIVDLIGFPLEAHGYEVARASDGEEALQLAQSLVPDVAVIDVMMPHRTGYEVTEWMRANEATASVPVILISAGTDSDAVGRAFEAGADAYIGKPFNPSDLRSRVAGLLAAEPATEL